MGKPEKIADCGPDTGSAPPTEAAQRDQLKAPASAGGRQPAPTPEISSEALLGGGTEVRIRHRGEIYRLTLTRAGKLILHK